MNQNKREKSNRSKGPVSAGLLLVLFLCLGGLLTGCGKQEPQYAYTYQISFLNKEQTALVTEDYGTDTSADNPSELVQELINKMTLIPENLQNVAPFSGDANVISFTLKDGQLNLDFDERYLLLEPTAEVLIRAAAVRTLSAVPGVESVSFTVLGTALTDASGLPVGTMSKDTFVDYEGVGINAYEETSITLYFASDDGSRLVPVTRTIMYNSNIAQEKKILEELIKGPVMSETGRMEKGKATINPNTKVLSATVQDGVCFVNLSSDFLTITSDVPSDLTIYSIVDSLTELPSVHKVQISVEGSVDITYKEVISLNTLFERNLDLLTGRKNIEP